MRTKIICILILTITSLNVLSQELKVDLAYKYIYSRSWDRMIQTYNFSRPFLTEKQPLIMYGLNASTSYIFKSTKKLKHGIALSYSHFRSSAENENLNNILNLHFLNVGYIVHFGNDEKTKGLYTDLIISAVSSGLFRRVNGESFTYDEKNIKAFGIGGDLSTRIGYYLNLKNKIYLSPFVLVGYTPYIYSPNSEAVINQTKELVSNNWTGIFSAQVGLTFHIRQL
jgi:hypothetical protein